MSIKRTIITTIVALALVAVVAPTVTQATTISDLMAQIAALQAQLQGLSGTTTTTSSTATGACAGVTFSRNLTTGSTGSDVKCLQVLLNNNGYKVAATGAGSPGKETSYFGPATLRAVRSFQQAKGFTPANQVGPMTRAALNAMLGSSTTTTTTTTTTLPQGCTSTLGFSSITGASCATGVVTTVTPTGAGLSVMLSSDNPMAGTVVAGQSIAPLTKLTFVNGDNAAVNVTSLKLQRIGVSADTDLTNVYLFNGAQRLTDAASVSTGMVNFNAPNGLFTVPSMGSLEITVAADVTGSAGETLGIALTAATNVTSNASSVHGNFPLNGNLMSMVSAPSTIGNVYVVSSSLSPLAACTATTCTVDPQVDYPVYQENYAVGNHAVNLTRLALRQIGSVRAGDIKNFRLYVDGTQVGAPVANVDANGYITFDLTSSPVPLTTATHVIKVLADITGGSSLNFSFSVQNAADVTFFETQYYVNVLLHLNSTTGTFSTQTAGPTGINAGTITIQKTTDSPTGNIVNTASNAVLARYTLTAAGEPVKVQSLKASVLSCPSTTNVGLRNGAIYANGVQVGSTATLLCTNDATASSLQYTLYQLGSSLIVNPGSPVTLEIRADIYATGTTALVAGTDSLTAELMGQTGNAQGQVSLNSANVPAASATVPGNALSVQAGALAVAKFTAYTSQTMVASGQPLKLADFVLSANTTEAININTIAVTLTTITPTNVTNLYVTYGNNQSTTPKATTTATADGNSWAVSNFQLASGASTDVSVWGTVAQGYTNFTASHADILVTGTTASSATTVYSGTSGAATDISGQNLTFTSGSIAENQDAGTPLAGVVSGNQTIVAAKYRITSSYDNYIVTEAKIGVPSVGTTDKVIASAMLVDDATGNTLATQNVLTGNYYYFTGLNLSVPRNTSKTITVKYTLATPDSVYSTDQLDVKATLSYIRYINGQGVQSALTAVTGVAGNDIYVFKAIPTFTATPFSSADQQSFGTNLTAGSETPLYRFSVAAPASGEVDLKQIKFKVSLTAATSFASENLSTFKIFRNGTQLTNVAIMNASSTSLTGVNSIGTGSNTVVVLFTSSSDEAIPAGSTYNYELRATPASFGKNTNGGNSVSVVLGADAAGTAETVAATKVYDYGTDTTVHQLATDATGTSATTDSIIWSDHSASVGHSSDVAGAHGSSADWANGMLTYLGLPLASQGISAQ